MCGAQVDLSEMQQLNLRTGRVRALRAPPCPETALPVMMPSTSPTSTTLDSSILSIGNTAVHTGSVPDRFDWTFYIRGEVP